MWPMNRAAQSEEYHQEGALVKPDTEILPVPLEPRVTGPVNASFAGRAVGGPR
jgi:hypothetical protein